LILLFIDREPFVITNDDQALLVARYLIEENDEEFLYFDENMTGNINIIKSILKKLIGHIYSWSKEARNRIHDEIVDVIILFNKYINFRSAMPIKEVSEKILKLSANQITLPVKSWKMLLKLSRLSLPMNSLNIS